MKLTRSLAAVVIGAASIAVAGTAAAETELVIVSWGGAYSKGSICETYAFVIECPERQEVGSWTARVSRCGFRRRAG